MQKKQGEPIARICRFCGKEITGGYEYVKTRHGTEMYICQKCISGMKGEKQ